MTGTAFNSERKTPNRKHMTISTVKADLLFKKYTGVNKSKLP